MMIRVPRSTLAGSCAHQLDDLVEGGVVEPVDLVVLDRDLAGRTASASTSARRTPWTRTAARSAISGRWT